MRDSDNLRGSDGVSWDTHLLAPDNVWGSDGMSRHPYLRAGNYGVRWLPDGHPTLLAFAKALDSLW